MKPLSFLLLVLFVADLIFDSVLGKLGTAPTRYLTKGLLMPLLLTYFIVEVKNNVTDAKLKLVRLICLALIFSFAGDMFLVNRVPGINFTLGLGFFFLVQLCYILFFYHRKPFIEKNTIFLFITALIIIGYMIIINYIFWKKMYYQQLIIIVTIYCCALGFMLLCAVNMSMSKRIYRIAVIFFIPGAVCFVASDSMIGFNRFYLPRPLPDYYITGTYCAAQLLIVMGAIQMITKKKYA